MDLCPTCKKPTDRATEPFPFCSPRCRMADLGKWLAGEYRVPVKVEEDEDGSGPGDGMDS